MMKNLFYRLAMKTFTMKSFPVYSWLKQTGEKYSVRPLKIYLSTFCTEDEIMDEINFFLKTP